MVVVKMIATHCSICDGLTLCSNGLRDDDVNATAQMVCDDGSGVAEWVTVFVTMVDDQC